MKGLYSHIFFTLVLAVFFCSCNKGPDPWSPKTYPRQLSDYKKDTALSKDWKKYKIKGHEDNSFFFARDGYESVISVYFTCGKYKGAPLDTLAESLAIPMGRDYKVVDEGYVGSGGDVYHLVAEGEYKYHKEELYLKEGLVPDLKATMILDAYVTREKDCVVDVVYAAPPEEYETNISAFHDYLESVGVAAERETGK